MLLSEVKGRGEWRLQCAFVCFFSTEYIFFQVSHLLQGNCLPIFGNSCYQICTEQLAQLGASVLRGFVDPASQNWILTFLVLDECGEVGPRFNRCQVSAISLPLGQLDFMNNSNPSHNDFSIFLIFYFQGICFNCQIL